MLRRGSLAMATSGSVHERRDEVIVLNCHARPGHREMLDRAERSAVRRLGTRRMKWRESRVFACTGFLGQSRPHGSRVRRPHRRQVTHTPTHSQRGKVQSLMRNTHSRTHPFSHPQADIRWHLPESPLIIHVFAVHTPRIITRSPQVVWALEALVNLIRRQRTVGTRRGSPIDALKT